MIRNLCLRNGKVLENGNELNWTEDFWHAKDYIVGLDPSLRGTAGVVFIPRTTYHNSKKVVPTQVLTFQLPTLTTAKRHEAIPYIYSNLVAFIDSFYYPPKYVAIEQYAFNAKSRSQSSVIEAGCAVRLVFWQNKVPVYEIPSSTWKRVIVGKGNASKDYVRKAVDDHWGIIFPTQDECDAWCIAHATEVEPEIMKDSK